MSGIMLGLAAGFSDAIANFTVNPVGLGTSTGAGGTPPTFTFYGYAGAGAVLAGGGVNASNFPSATFGTATPPTINGAQIVGVYSVYTDPATTGTVFNVVVAGDYSALTNTVNTFSIGGTSVSTGATKTVSYLAGINATRFTFTQSVALASPFLPNGGSKAVIIT
ncbi:hypothetical protein UFOVP168_23 [uncultured Caudovirales phage]|uniref:Uncharacterized protein n=1 Tax=uncultured Caudovirales phage TaxID=2100421 RepID=A0A6J7WB73_9CAUD|nr:hypothetical protein UFOVP168_23 [uncultured Caudovirales phage]